jgi:hypothetical protein
VNYFNIFHLLGRIIGNNVSIAHSTKSLTEDDINDVSATVYVTMERDEK